MDAETNTLYGTGDNARSAARRAVGRIARRTPLDFIAQPKLAETGIDYHTKCPCQIL